MSCNHNKALEAVRRAKDLKALSKLFSVLQERYPGTISSAWEYVNLYGHKCPICGEAGLRYSNGETEYVCPACKTDFSKTDGRNEEDR